MNSNLAEYKMKLSYYNAMVDESEARLYKEKLDDANIALKLYDKTGKYMCCLDDFTNQISLALNSTLVQACMTGMLSNGTYDILKSYILWIWKSVKGKIITKAYAGGQIEKKEATFGLHISIDKYTEINFRLDGEVSDKLKNKCVDNIFQFINEIPRKNRSSMADFAVYDWEKQKWDLIDVYNEIQKHIEEQKKMNRIEEK